MKKCSKCKQWKSETKYNTDKQKKDGLYSSCNDCRSKTGKNRIKQMSYNEKENFLKKQRDSYRRTIETSKAYEQSFKRKIIHRERERIRANGFKWIQLMNNIYPKEIFVVQHHVHDWFVFPLPDITHRRLCGRKVEHRKIANELIKNIFDIDIEYILNH